MKIVNIYNATYYSTEDIKALIEKLDRWGGGYGSNYRYNEVDLVLTLAGPMGKFSRERYKHKVSPFSREAKGWGSLMDVGDTFFVSEKYTAHYRLPRNVLQIGLARRSHEPDTDPLEVLARVGRGQVSWPELERQLVFVLASRLYGRQITREQADVFRVPLRYERATTEAKRAAELVLRSAQVIGVRSNVTCAEWEVQAATDGLERARRKRDALEARLDRIKRRIAELGGE